MSSEIRCLVGVVISRANLEILLISAYLPPNLDVYGTHVFWDSDNKDEISQSQESARNILQYKRRYIHWIVGGDLNETRAPMDSIRVSSFKKVPKFVDEF